MIQLIILSIFITAYMYLPKLKNLFAIFLVLVSFFSCITSPPHVSYLNYKINTQPNDNNDFSKMLAPYKDSLGKTMDVVIGFSVNGLTKKQPESVLGNFMTDAIKTMAEKKYNKKVEAAFINFGGIRSYIPKGEVTIGKIFELMPFDNLIVLQELNGIQLKTFLNRVCEKGGFPVSEGLTYSIKEKKLGEVFVNGKPVEDNATYTIANSDYIANGGDNCEMLKTIARQNKNYLMRDALIEYVQQLTQDGKTVDAKIENRVTYGK